MRLLKIFLLSFLIFNIDSGSAFTQTPTHQSLLWRISGKGLSRPSYLFGTMHVRNKKAFNFKDSLYHVIENTEGFALESHPDSMSQIITAYIEGKLDPEDFEGFENAEKPDIDDKELEKIFKKISKDPSYNKLSRKEKFKMITSKMLNEEADDSLNMDVFMDAYLFRLASQQGKSIFGLEKIEDQIHALTYLSKGLKLSAIDGDIGNLDFSNGSPLHRFYYKEDLDGVQNFFTTYFSDSVLKVFLYNRNKVMAHKMDSLMHTISLTTAVGAGHLSGKEGIISLLREKGYTVEPVLSSKKLFAWDYKIKGAIVKKGWVADSSEILAFRYEMPGKPVNQSGNGREVKYYYDLGAGLMYMVIAGTITESSEKEGLENIFDEHLKTYLESINGEIIDKTRVTVNSLQGFDVTIKAAGTYSRAVELFDNNRFYLLMMTAERKAALLGENAGYFINSLRSNPLVKKEWKQANFDKAGFSVSVPGQMSEKNLESNNENADLIEYSVFDPVSNTLYGIYLTKTKPGIKLSSLPILSASYISSFSNNMGNKKIEQTDTTFSGFPSVHFISPENGGRGIQGLIIKRNNICYLVTAEFDFLKMNNDDLNKFFNSFSLNEFPEKEWNVFTSPDHTFSTKAPGKINEKKEDEDGLFSGNNYMSRTFNSIDAENAILYQVIKEKVNEYYWAANTDSVYNHWKHKYQGNTINDSVISYTETMNGGIKGRELIVNNKYERSVSRYRFILSGDTMYVLETEITGAFRKKEKENLFFESFKVTHEEKPDMIYTRTPDKLFRDLISSDSVVFPKAYNAIDEVRFEPLHYEMIISKALEQYPENEGYYQTVNDKLFYIGRNLLEKYPGLKSTTEELVRKYYPGNDSHSAKQRFQLLTLLSKCKTQSSFVAIKEMLAKALPQKSNPYEFYYWVTDSLQLSTTLFPDILNYIPDTINGMRIVSLTKELIDSNILSREILFPVQKDLLQLAERNLLSVKQTNEDYDYATEDLLQLLGLLKQPPADIMLGKYLTVKQTAIKKTAALELLKNGKPVSSVHLKKIAEEDEFRADLYKELSKLGKHSLFPADFATQQYMGMSYVYQQAIYEEDMASGIRVIYIKKAEREYKGEKKRFFIYRVVFSDPEDEKSEETYAYLAVAGPFAMNVKELIPGEKEDITGLYYEKEFDPYQIDQFFENYINNTLKSASKE